MKIFAAQKIYMEGQNFSALDHARGRLLILSLFFLLLGFVVIARLIDLSLIQAVPVTVSEADSIEDPLSFEDQAAHRRGDIVDRNGITLARSLNALSLYADPALVNDPKKLAKDLSVLFPDQSFGILLQKLQNDSRFVWIRRHVTPEEQAKILMIGDPALGFREETVRTYPQGAMAAHLVGVVGQDKQGLAGIEASFEPYLRAQDREALKLTLDIRIQHALRREMNKAVQKHKAKGAAGLVMDVNTGEILAMSSLPDFDPYHYAESKPYETFNKVTLGVYELGSTFKIFSTAALLEQKSSAISAAFDVRNPIKSGRFTIRDYHPEKRVLTTPEVFIHSSNIGSAMMGERVGTEALKKFYADLGLLSRPDFELKEVGRPLYPEPWRDIHTLTASYGHGVAVSPLQLVRAVSSIVNGGYLVVPKLVLGAGQSQESIQRVRVVSDETAHRMRQLLRLVVTEGTGGKADASGYLVGGKTGTAEKPGQKGYDRNLLISSFLGVFPMDKPRYAVFVMVDEPQGIKETYGYATGGWVAAPAVKNVIEAMGMLLNIPPATGQDNFESSLLRYVKTKEEIKKEQDSAVH